jgi:hypothetical protein|tara:strand:- start:475 stop:666 length:192 start_codon:yes stop_codon:yes gene_type:complete
MEARPMIKPGRKKREGKRVTMVIPTGVYDKLEATALSDLRTISAQAVVQICKSFDHEVTEHDN